MHKLITIVDKLIDILQYKFRQLCGTNVTISYDITYTASYNYIILAILYHIDYHYDRIAM